MKISFPAFLALFFAIVPAVRAAQSPAAKTPEGHPTHTEHQHAHGPTCGHKTVAHAQHVDYVHDGHYHASHETHYDEHGLVTAEAVSAKNDQKVANHTHQHSATCGHASIAHGDHVDYTHDGHFHAGHDEHYDDHGVSVATSK